MRLISAKKFLKDGKIYFKEIYRDPPPYAILSHTWEEGQEVTYDDCKSTTFRDKKGCEKIRNTCRLAIDDGIGYIWIDTCCIDKSSSAELTEAINSMYKWYQQADICYAHLSDLAGGNLKDCRWFRRGWTLQELIAPKAMRFFDRSWKFAGDKKSLLKQLSTVTNVDIDILSHAVPLSSACVARRFSWAANRETTREEDLAYCLLGIFDINMPMLYGEGRKAFVRLQEEIIKSTHDLSIFGWTPSTETAGNRRHYCGFLADSPNAFASCSRLHLRTDPLVNEGEMSITNKGVLVEAAPHFISKYDNGDIQYSLSLKCTSGKPGMPVLIPMRKIGPSIFVRAANMRKSKAASPKITWSSQVNSKAFTLLTKLPRELSQRPGDGDMVSALRHAIIAIELPADTEKLQVNAVPQKYWDAEDFVFFSPNTTARHWGSVMLPDALFICFWHKDDDEWKFQGTILNSDADCIDGLVRDLYVFAEALDYPASVVDVTLLRAYGNKSRQSSTEVKSQGKTMNISFKVKRADDQRVCRGPRFRVQISRVPVH